MRLLIQFQTLFHTMWFFAPQTCVSSLVNVPLAFEQIVYMGELTFQCIKQNKKKQSKASKQTIRKSSLFLSTAMNRGQGMKHVCVYSTDEH